MTHLLASERKSGRGVGRSLTSGDALLPVVKPLSAINKSSSFSPLKNSINTRQSSQLPGGFKANCVMNGAVRYSYTCHCLAYIHLMSCIYVCERAKYLYSQFLKGLPVAAVKAPNPNHRTVRELSQILSFLCLTTEANTIVVMAL